MLRPAAHSVLAVRTSKRWLSGFPAVAREWHPTANGARLPLEVTSGSSSASGWPCHTAADQLSALSETSAAAPFRSGRYSFSVPTSRASGIVHATARSVHGPSSWVRGPSGGGAPPINPGEGRCGSVYERFTAAPIARADRAPQTTAPQATQVRDPLSSDAALDCLRASICLATFARISLAKISPLGRLHSSRLRIR
jgi:hypothetical protein